MRIGRCVPTAASIGCDPSISQELPEIFWKHRRHDGSTSDRLRHSSGPRYDTDASNGDLLLQPFWSRYLAWMFRKFRRFSGIDGTTSGRAIGQAGSIPDKSPEEYA